MKKNQHQSDNAREKQLISEQEITSDNGRFNNINKMKLFDTTTHPAMLALHDFGSKDFERFYKKIKFIDYYEGGKSIL